MEDILSDSESREIQAAIQTPEGRAKIGQTMLEPFKLGRDYVAIGRQVFAVDHLPAAKKCGCEKFNYMLENPVLVKGMDNQQERSISVVCRLCEESFCHISASHVKKHGVTLMEYRSIFVDAPIHSTLFLENLRAGSKGSGTKSTITKMFRYGTANSCQIMKLKSSETTCQTRRPIWRKDIVQSALKDAANKIKENGTNVVEESRHVILLNAGNSHRFKSKTTRPTLKIEDNQQERAETFHCLICNKLVKRITTLHLTKECVGKANTPSEYRLQFPDAPLQSEAAKHRATIGVRKWISTLSAEQKLERTANARKKSPAATRKYWDAIPTKEERRIRLKNWIQAGAESKWGNPMTSLEKLVIDMEISNLKFSGDAKKWIWHEKNRKNPDFFCPGLHRVVEVFGTYVHGPDVTGEDNEAHQKNCEDFYDKSGYDCLVIWESDLTKSLEQVRQRIINFCNPQRLDAKHFKPRSEDIVRSNEKPLA